MDAFLNSDFQRLMQIHGELCLSIYLPTDPAGKAGEVGPIELGNLLDAAENDLLATGARAADIRDLMQPARKLAGDVKYWKSQSQGLALFLNGHSMQAWRLPLKFPLFFWVGSHFHLKPLLPLIGKNDRYFLLAVSQRQVRFYNGTANGLTEMHVDQLPGDLTETLHYHQPEGVLQVRSVHAAAVHGAVRGKAAKEGAVFHGQGAATEHAKDDILAYFRAIDRALKPTLHGQSAPLLFAGVDYLFPLYREANTYRALVETAIQGNADHWSPTELQTRAQPIMEPYWNRTRRQDAERLRELSGGDRVSCDIERVLPAAAQGRVEAVFVANDEQLWGSFDAATQHVEVCVDQTKGTEDLLDLTARLAISKGGRAYAIPATELPSAGLLLAALYRFGIK